MLNIYFNRRHILYIVVIALLFVGIIAGVSIYNSILHTGTEANAEENIVQPLYPDESIPLVKYEGPVHHVFFHSLVVYPELAFDGDYRSEGYDMWMTTVSEFKAMLPQLKERGYILYNINELIEPDPNDPTKIKLKDIYLPEGRIPLVISIDDVNYYDYMLPDGFATRMVLDNNGDIAHLIKTPEGNEIISREADVMPILDDFVKQNPDFSFKGAKGIVATTGYAGAFGYRITDLEGEELVAAQNEVTKIANRLKETGWEVANHSYTHNQYFQNGKLTPALLESDVTRWKNLIGNYTGQTNIFISPFGVHMKADHPHFRYLVEQGYNIYCPVERTPRLKLNGDNVVMNRFNLDGYTMRRHKEYINNTYFNVDEVYDKSRPQ